MMVYKRVQHVVCCMIMFSCMHARAGIGISQFAEAIVSGCCARKQSAEDDVMLLVQQKKDALRGSLTAKKELGFRYVTGQGVMQDHAQAFTYFSGALASNDPEVQYSLGLLYASGLGCTRNPARARELFELAAAQDYVPAQQALMNIQVHARNAIDDAQVLELQPVEGFKEDDGLDDNLFLD